MSLWQRILIMAAPPNSRKLPDTKTPRRGCNRADRKAVGGLAVVICLNPARFSSPRAPFSELDCGTEQHSSKRKRPGPTSKRSRPRQAQTPVSIIHFRAARAAMLDRLADQELQLGHHHQAERLSHRAAEMREQARWAAP